MQRTQKTVVHFSQFTGSDTGVQMLAWSFDVFKLQEILSNQHIASETICLSSQDDAYIMMIYTKAKMAPYPRPRERSILPEKGIELERSSRSSRQGE